jgi:hypothetical protein
MEMKNGSSVEGDLLFGGFQTQLAGDVTGDAIMAGNSVAILGSIDGNAEVEVGEAGAGPPFSPFMFMPDAPQIPTVPSGLTVGNNAFIGGRLHYTAPEQATIPSGIDAEYTPFIATETAIEESTSLGQNILNWLLNAIRNFISLLIVGLLLIWLLPKCIKRYTNVLADNPLVSLGLGVAAFFVLPLILLITAGFAAGLAVIFGVLTVGNLSITALLLGIFIIFSIILVTYLVAIWGAKIVVSVWLGRLITQHSSTNFDQSPYWSFLIGLVIVVLVTTIPILGGLLNFAILLLGLGALVLWIWMVYKGDTTLE